MHDQAEAISQPTPPSLRVINGTGGPTQLALSLDWDVAPGVPAVPPIPPALHLVTAEEPQPAHLPDPRQWTAQMARAIVEVANGERPPQQLNRWVARDVLARLARRGSFVARHPASRARHGMSRRRAVRAVRVCPVAPGIVESSAVLVGAERAMAVALRLEARDGRWVTTAVEMR